MVLINMYTKLMLRTLTNKPTSTIYTKFVNKHERSNKVTLAFYIKQP